MASNFALYCTPAVNLFQKRVDRIHVGESAYEYHVVPDRTRPLDFEVYEVTSVVGHGSGVGQRTAVSAVLLGVQQRSGPSAVRLLTRRAASRGWCPRARSGAGPGRAISGREVFLALVDSAQAPFSGDLRQLSIEALCTNRDLVLQMPVGVGRSDLSLDAAAPLVGIRVLSGPSRPYAPLADGAIAWRAISHLSLNYLSLVQSTPEEGAAALRDLLELYAASADVGARRQIEGIRSVRVGRVVRRLLAPGPLAFGRGIEITVLDRRAGVRGGERVSARVGARSLFRASRVDQLVHGNRAAVREPRGNQPMGASNRARDRRSSVLRGAGGGAVPARLLPDAAPAGVPVRREAALGTGPASGRRARASGPGLPTCRLRPRRWPPSSAGGEESRGCRSGSSACSAPTGRCRFTSRSTRASACSMRAIRRSAGFSISSIIGSSRSSTGRGRRRSRTSIAIA